MDESENMPQVDDDQSEKGDIRNVPKHIIKEFIDVYKAHPALWMLKNKDIYGNRNLKFKGHQALVQVWRKFDELADIKMVKSKIQSIRGSFRKELKKVQKSMKSGSGADDIYKPQLWYFGMLSFLTDHEVPTESVDNLDTMTADSNETQEVIHVSTESLLTSDSSLHQPKKRKKCTEEEERRKFLSACTNVLNNERTVTDGEAFGTYVSKKLEKVTDECQKTIRRTTHYKNYWLRCNGEIERKE